MKVLDYEGLKQVVSKIKGLIDKKADKLELERVDASTKFTDTKDTNENPSWYLINYPKSIVKEKKIPSNIGLGNKISSQYCWLITINGNDANVGYLNQFCVSTFQPEVYTRASLGATSWSDWKRVLNEDDVKTNLSQFNSDPNNRLVTDSEKNNWNSKLSSVYGADISRSKAKGYNTSNTWQSLSTTRDLEDWIGDFDKRTRENKSNIISESSVKQIVQDNSMSRYDITRLIEDKTLSRYEITQIIEQNGVNESKVRDIAKEIAYAGVIQSYDSNVGSKLNSIFGTSFWSNIYTFSDLVGSYNAISELINNRAAFGAMLNVQGFLKVAVNSDTFSERLIDNDTAFEVYLNSPMALKATNGFSTKLRSKIQANSSRDMEFTKACRAYGLI